jgi:hypothetical protein
MRAPIRAQILVIALIPAMSGCASSAIPRVASPESIVLRQDTLIRAEPSAIWQTLVDLPRYGEWNPWLIHAEGDLRPGGTVWANVILGKSTMHAEHIVLSVDANARLCWRDAGWNSIFVYGQRCRTLEALSPGVVRFREEILLEGAFQGLALSLYGDALRAGIAAESRALKARVESSSHLP